MRFLNSVSAEKCKRLTLWDFLTSIVLQNIETNEGETLWWNPKTFFKFHNAEKNLSEKHLDSQSVFSRLWMSVLFLFVLAWFRGLVSLTP